MFGSVSLFAAENEMMLRPHLHVIVNKSMDLAKTAKEPYNYFLLVSVKYQLIAREQKYKLTNFNSLI